MKHPKIAFIFFIIWLLVIFTWYKTGSSLKTENDKLLKNNIEFTGTLKSVKVSRNHCFAIISIGNVKSNVESFNPDLKDRYFPYSIKNGLAEIYTLLCEETIKEIGSNVKLNSNQRKLILEINHKPSEFEINITSESPDIKFIKENTKL
ncbi:hypothetical protein ACUN24_00930 [Pedobacter sp. WC2501]|uniref:hypothetical protein n=1 Tax=Pedobacter sp. WC2501 TaxID=3461400 RepID=UPI004045B451